MISVSLVLWFLFTHFLADFLFQDKNWGENKYKDIDCLTTHTLFYTLIWCIALCLMKIPGWDGVDVVVFCIVTFAVHTFTDFFTSKVMHWMYVKEYFGTHIPNIGFFTFLGFDQVLHFTQLFLTYKFIN